MNNTDPVARQRAYYAETAKGYESLHGRGEVEHEIALALLEGACTLVGAKTLLDVGSGTGRVLHHFRSRAFDQLQCVGIEPVAELRAVGHANGIPESMLVAGDANSLAFSDDSFDVVCAFGVLHHVPDPGRVVAEMLRVARKAILISDANSFGQGSWAARTIKQAIRSVGLWPFANWIKTRGKGYTISAEDGLAYSYSVFQDLPAIRAKCRHVHLLGTKGEGNDLYRTVSHVAVLGLL